MSNTRPDEVVRHKKRKIYVILLGEGVSAKHQVPKRKALLRLPDQGLGHTSAYGFAASRVEDKLT
jgi:hypothetical protein